ncbi:MAG: DUF1223 domain-containing protein [Sulfitobacter sp.]|jgi:hypothetical protein
MTRISNILTAAFLGLTASVALPVAAEQRAVVVELYTSQGCSSCPPADVIFNELAERDDVIAIALHVDYWDYIGWKDEFGDPAHADRQRAYANTAGRRSIYTPEMVVNGQTDIVGAKPMKLFNAIAEHKETPVAMTLDVARDGKMLSVKGTVPRGKVVPMEIHVLEVTPVHISKISRGENRGKTIKYSNIAHNWRIAGTWDGKSPLEMSVDTITDDPVVVLVQEAGAGPIIAAARVN